jgi:predicted dehydrogenase
MNKTLNWGILATGNIANTFARALKLSTTGKLVAAGSRTQEGADRFGQTHGITRCYGSYQALLDDPEVDAIYISTPHPMHVEWAVKAAQAKKHILCEKPISMTAREAQAMVDAAKANDICLMEAFMYRCHPQTAKLIELIQNKAIGEVRMIQANYGFNSRFDPAGRLFCKELGGGGILDVGCYPMSYSRLIAAVAMGKECVEPVDVQAVGHLGSTGVDEWSSTVMRFENGLVANLSTATQAFMDNGLKIFGSTGRIHVPHAFHPNYWGGEGKIMVQYTGWTPMQEITVKTELPLFTIAIDTFARHALSGDKQVAWPGMRWDDTVANARTLDRWRECIGLEFDADRATA